MEFFTGANTVNGFKSLFDECFKESKRLYILKGSSGCGKSTLMRRIAGRAQREGLEYDIIRCSADPESLDGVIIPKLSIAVADGTAPHIMDVKYPAVRESIVNLGQFWDESKILPHSAEIISLTESKSAKYLSAYNALAAYGRVSDMIREIVSKAIMREKLDEFVLSLADKIMNAKGNRKRLLTSAFTSLGIKTLETFGDIERVIKISGLAAEYALRSLQQIATERGAEYTVSCCATDISMPETLIFKNSGTLITLLEKAPCASCLEEKTISSARFIDNSVLASARVRMKTLTRLSEELLGEAKNELAAARSIHSEIESLYIPAMDFERLNEFTLKLIEGIFANK